MRGFNSTLSTGANREKRLQEEGEGPPHTSEPLHVLGAHVFRVVGPKTVAPPVEGPPVLALTGLEARLRPPSVCPSPLRVDSLGGWWGTTALPRSQPLVAFLPSWGRFGHECPVQARVLRVNLAAVTATCHPALFSRTPDPTDSAQ